MQVKKIHTKQKKAKRGRPPSGRDRMQVKIDPANRAWLESEAERLGCSMSDVMNNLIAEKRR